MSHNRYALAGGLLHYWWLVAAAAVVLIAWLLGSIVEGHAQAPRPRGYDASSALTTSSNCALVAMPVRLVTMRPSRSRMTDVGSPMNGP
jgi:hypothetical protein